MSQTLKRQTFVCRWRSCGNKFTDKASLVTHISTHLDQQELDNLLETKKHPSSSTKEQSSVHTATYGNAVHSSPAKPASGNSVSAASSTALNSKNSSNAAPMSGDSDSELLPATSFGSKMPKKKRQKKIIDTGDDIICIMCKSPDFSSNDQIVMCDKCSDWYHQKCHTPPISDHFIKNVQLQWLCKNCKV